MHKNKIQHLFAEAIRTWRVELRMSQKQLAERIGINENTLGRNLKGDASMSVDTLLKIGNVKDLRSFFLHMAEVFKEYQFRELKKKGDVVIGVVLLYDKPFAYAEFEVEGTSTVITFKEGETEKYDVREIHNTIGEYIIKKYYDDIYPPNKITVKESSELVEAYITAYELRYK